MTPNNKPIFWQVDNFSLYTVIDKTDVVMIVPAETIGNITEAAIRRERIITKRFTAAFATPQTRAGNAPRLIYKNMLFFSSIHAKRRMETKVTHSATIINSFLYAPLNFNC